MNAATVAMIAIKTLQKDSKKYLYKDFFKISKLELHLISLGSEFQNLVADTWKVQATIATNICLVFKLSWKEIRRCYTVMITIIFYFFVLDRESNSLIFNVS